MTTRIRDGFKGFGAMAAAGLLSVLGMTSARATGLQTAAWLGQMEVTAPVTRLVAHGARAAVANLGSMTVTATRQVTNAVANLGSMTVTATRQVTNAVANLGSMTVTAKATREARVGEHSRPVDSTGESDDQRARSPRAVLVQ